MGLVTLPNTLSDGDIPSAAQFNANWSTLYDEFNGGIDNDNIAADANIASSKIASELDNKTLDSYITKGIYDNGNSGASKEIDWSNGDKQKITLTANCVLTYANAVAGQTLTLIIIQDGTGSRTLTFPTGTKWTNNGEAPTMPTGASDKSVVAVLYDGSVYLSQAALDFA